MHVTLRLTAIAGAMALISGMANAAREQPIQGGTLIYLEQQAHTNLYPPAGGFYPNGGILDQITDKLTWQNPETLQVEPWIGLPKAGRATPIIPNIPLNSVPA